MKLAPIVILLRAGETRFNDQIAGAVEFATVQKDTLEFDTAYIIPIPNTALPNTTQGTVEQKLIEGFGIVAAVKNDQSQADKTGLTAYDQMHDIRKEFWDILVGLNLDNILNTEGYTVEGPISYKGDSLIDVNPAWLWYLYEFEFPVTIQETAKELDLDNLDTISAQWIISPNSQLPLKGAEPLPDAVEKSDMESIIDLTENLLAGAFTGGFDAGFDLYEG